MLVVTAGGAVYQDKDDKPSVAVLILHLDNNNNNNNNGAGEGKGAGEAEVKVEGGDLLLFLICLLVYLLRFLWWQNNGVN